VTEGIFEARTRLAVFAVGLVSLIAFLSALVFGRDLSEAPPQIRDSLGQGPYGHRAFVEVLEASGLHVTRWTRPNWEQASAPLFVIEPNATSLRRPDGDVHLAEMLTTRQEQGLTTVIVLGKWAPGPLNYALYVPDEEGVLVATLPGQTLALAESRKWQDVLAEDVRGVARSLRLRAPTMFASGVLQPVLRAGDEVLVGRLDSEDGGRTYFVSDADLLHNFNLHRAEHAAFWLDFVQRELQTDTIVVDEVFHEAPDTKSLARLFSSWPGVLALVHVGLLVIVVLSMGRVRFGPPHAAEAPHGRGPLASVQVAAGLMARGNQTRLARTYVEEVLHDVHQRLRLGPAKTDAERARLIDEYAERRGKERKAERLLAESENPGAALEAARSVAALRRLLLDGATSATPTG
jgi:hypothetical protein